MAYTFKINDCTWNIVLTQDESLLLVNNMVGKGSIVYRTRTIYIDNRISLDNIRRVLGHELAHAFMYDTQAVCIPPYTEEDICEFVSIYNQKIYRIIDRFIRKHKKT